jgi:hypothetical protein
VSVEGRHVPGAPGTSSLHHRERGRGTIYIGSIGRVRPEIAGVLPSIRRVIFQNLKYITLK